ncbi:MAG TPA: bifunctional nuclease family protein [Anaerolineales bacterium]|nr:bifunctional nuclease family protein [Anaerolineales bacterium]
MSNMIEVRIDNIRVSLMSPQRLVILREREGTRYIPIWVGPYEAEAITVALNEIEIVRPLTHDLLRNLFVLFDAHIKRIDIIDLREDIFYANIVFEAGGQEYMLDSRPSDAIALAVRARVPILVSPEVMDAAGVLPEEDLDQKKPSVADDVFGEQKSKPKPASPPVKEDPEDNDRLSIFEDFLKNIDEESSEDDSDLKTDE